MHLQPELIRVFEYGSVTWKPGKYHCREFKEEHYHAFERFFNEHEQTPFFELIPHGVRFKSYVGAIHIGKLTIEVLPKAGKDGTPEEWQHVLLDMLKTCSLLTAKETGNAPLNLRANSVLELYFELFLKELEMLLHRGLIKKYRKKEGQMKALKGALVFSQHVSKNAVHRERFYTRHTTYDKDHLIHRILHEALLLIGHLTDAPMLMDHIGRLKLDFPEVPRMKVNAAHFDRMVYNRKTEPYRKALDIAKLLLLNFRPDLSSGRNDMLALMFDMNTLWEEFIFRKLQRDLRNDYHVLGQRRKYFWEHKSIKPDIVLKSKTNETLFVIDTKWKVIDSRQPADDDLKQMYVYNHHWDARKSLLLYPLTRAQKDLHGKFRLQWGKDDHHCVIGFVEVLKGKRLNPNLSREILGILRPQMVLES